MKRRARTSCSKWRLTAGRSIYIRYSIPRNPNAAEFRQGNTLGPDNRHWFRAKFHERYRLLYRFSSNEKVIVYAWVNDENTLRKAGSKTDPYAVFRAMFAVGNPLNSIAQLLAVAKRMQADTSSGGGRKSAR